MRKIAFRAITTRCAKAGLPCNDRLVAYGEPDESGGEQAMTELLGRGRNFTAVASYNDSMAHAAQWAC